MVSLKNFSKILLTVVLLSACSMRDQNRSSMQLVMPPHPDVSTKATNSSLSLTDQNFCYFANVLGSGITQTPYSCAPTIGTNSGFVAPSSKVELSIPKGTERKIEIYGYLASEGQSCSSLPADLSGVPLNRIFRMGSAENVDTSQDETVVTITITFPGVQQHYGLQAGLSPNCYANLSPILPPSNDIRSPVQIGQSFSIKSRISSGSAPNSIVSGSSFKILGGAFHVSQ